MGARLRGELSRNSAIKLGFGLRVGEREVERKPRAAFSGSEPERNVAAEPQTEASASAVKAGSSTRDERARSAAERAWSEGRQGNDQETGQRNAARVGHGGMGSLRGAPARNARSENPRLFSNGSTRASISNTG